MSYFHQDPDWSDSPGTVGHAHAKLADRVRKNGSGIQRLHVAGRGGNSIVSNSYDTLEGDKEIFNHLKNGMAESTEKTKVSSDDPVSKRWDDIVFENRNRDYGAYVLRKGYGNSVFIGLIITAVVIVLLLAIPIIKKLLRDSGDAEAVIPKRLVYTELMAPPPIDKPKPPPPQLRLPKLQKVIKFVPPKVVKEEVIETLPTIEEIKENVTASVESEGAEIVFDEPVEQVVAPPDDNELFTAVEQMPEFEGGREALMAFIKQNMIYPSAARRLDLEGTVYVTFVVNKNGTISDVKILRGIMAECDNEAMRVVGKMPPWKPGRQNGKNVNVRFTLPLKFRLG